MPRARRRFRSIALAAIVLAGAAACGPAGISAADTVGGATAAPRPVSLIVFAAASLQKALAAAAQAYESEHPAITLTVSTGASSALATQIEQGAQADVFLSADTASAERLATGGLTDGAPTPFAANAPAIVVPASNPAGIRSPADLARPGVKIVTAAPAVPIARYAAQLVANLGRQPGYPTDYASRYAANVVSREDDVEAIVAKLELGEGDAGIVYATDAAAAAPSAATSAAGPAGSTGGGLVTIPIPAAANVAATYAGAVLKGSSNRADADAFLQWLAGPEGQSILRRFGFGSPS